MPSNLTPKLLLTSIITLLITSCVSPNLLTYSSRSNYFEKSILEGDTIIRLRQAVCFDKPHRIDEEFCHWLIFTLPDSNAAVAKRNLNLKTDTLLVKSKYELFSVWNWQEENNSVSGKIFIQQWEPGKVVLRERIKVIDHRRHRTLRLTGTRTFLPQTP
jgi:hypothetical protein